MNGYITLDCPLSDEQALYISRFSKVQHVRRDNWELWEIPDPCRTAVELPLGVDAEFYMGPIGLGILDATVPPRTQPSQWCGWIPSPHKKWIIWAGEYQGSNYNLPAEWLRYLMRKMLTPWGHSANGYVEWFNDSRSDVGAVQVENSLAYLLKPREITRPIWSAI